MCEVDGSASLRAHLGYTCDDCTMGTGPVGTPSQEAGTSGDVSPSSEEHSEPVHQPDDSSPPRSSWPVVVVPLAVIVGTAIAGELANSGRAALLAGVASTALISAVSAYRLLGRAHRWQIAAVVATIAFSAVAIGVAWLHEADEQRSNSPVTPSATVAIQTPPLRHQSVYAGRTFSQDEIAAIRSFRGADLRGAKLVELDLRRMDFSGADAAGASFENSQLEHAIFRGANLGGAILRGTCLRYARLDGADVTGVDADGANVEGVQLPPASASAPKRWPVTSDVSAACDEE